MYCALFAFENQIYIFIDRYHHITYIFFELHIVYYDFSPKGRKLFDSLILEALIHCFFFVVKSYRNEISMQLSEEYTSTDQQPI